MIHFLHPWYLLGLVLAGAPVIIHFWFLRRLRRMEFSSLKFLEAVEREQFSWLKLREILILILRTCTILCAVGALARPTVQASILGANRTASVILIIDDSYSMGRDSLWPATMRTATALVDAYSKSSGFAVIPLTKPARVDFVGQEEARRIIARMVLSYRRGRLGQVADLIPLLSPHHPPDYVFFTDGQAGCFTDLKKPFGPRLNVVRLDAPEDNIGLAQMRIEDPVSAASNRIIVAVKNNGRKEWSGKVALSTGQEQQMTLAGGVATRLSFELPRQETTSVSAQVDDDALQADNVRYLVFKPPGAKKILLVNQDTAAGLFISKALAPSGVGSPFQIEEIGGSDIKGKDFSAFDALILSDLNEIGSFEARRIERYLQEKPVLVLQSEVPGPELEGLLSRAVGRLKAVRLGGFLSIKRLRAEHPIFTGFGLNDFGGAKFFSVCDVERDKAGVLIWLEEDRPLVVENENLIVVTTALDLEHTDFVYRAAFAPFLHRVLGYMTQDRVLRNKAVGDSLVVRASTGLEAVTPIGREYLVSRHGQAVVRNTETPGLYRVGNESFAVNVDPEEGDLKSMEKAGLEMLNAEAIDARHVGQGSDLSPIMLIVCVIALALEMVLLMRK